MMHGERAHRKLTDAARESMAGKAPRDERHDREDVLLQRALQVGDRRHQVVGAVLICVCTAFVW